ncbi:MAG TPA: hypothetical protein VNE16_04365 [Vicinamibacterales bacterium]|nr:hypothetical protein [Vicinamibacterales bacterium]
MTTSLLTVAELARVVSRLEHRPCSSRRVRYLLVVGGLGTDTHRRRHGQTRLYGVLDVALVRLAVRLEREGVSPSVTRVVLTYLRNDLIKAWRAGALLGLAVRGVRGSLEPVLKARPAWAVAWVPLREIWRGLDAEVRRIGDARQTLWMWRDVPIHEIPRAGA